LAIIDNIRRLPSGFFLFIINAHLKQFQKIRVWFGMCQGFVWRNPDLYNALLTYTPVFKVNLVEKGAVNHMILVD